MTGALQKCAKSLFPFYFSTERSERERGEEEEEEREEEQGESERERDVINGAVT